MKPVYKQDDGQKYKVTTMINTPETSLKSKTSVKSITQDRYQFGKDLLGPVMADYLQKLDAHLDYFSKIHDAKILFLSRAGIRIEKALTTYLKSSGQALPKPYQKNNSDYFWVSRLMIAKGIWNKRPHNSVVTISKEFPHNKIADLVKAVTKSQQMPGDIEAQLKKIERNGDQLQQFLDTNSKPAQYLKDYLKIQSTLFEDYLEATIGDHKKVLLVDTGWQGTAQTLLAEAYPTIEWWGAYFGRSGFPSSNRKFWHNMIGLVFEQDAYEYEKPETSIIQHRHLIEDLLEPSGQSVEYLAKNDAGKIFAPDAEEILADAPTKTSDPIYMGVIDYLSQPENTSSLSTIHKNARLAWDKIAKTINLPTKEETELFSNISRSADFGKDLKVDLLLPPKKRHNEDTPEKRIGAALWQAGQAAIEYPTEIAEPLQRKIANLDRFDFKEKPQILKKTSKPQISKHPKVAIITRTLDRPMFLKRALESVAGQTFQDYVQVVVNDGGDNEVAAETIKNTNCLHHQIILVDNVVNRGMEAASNIAIAAADSDYIIIHDDDDSWEPAFLEKTVAFLEGPKGKTYGGVITQSTYVSEEVTPEGIKIHDTSRYQGWVENVHIMEMAIGNFFPPIAFLFRRDIYDKIGKYNEDYPVLGDWDFNLRFLLESDIGMVHEPLANYHHRDRGDTSLFGNSVIAGRDKHLEYSAVVRNRFARNLLHSDHPAVAVMVGMGMHLDANRHAIRDIQSKTSNTTDTPDLSELNSLAQSFSRSSTDKCDDMWVAMHRLHQAIKDNDVEVLKKVGCVPKGVVNSLIAKTKITPPTTALDLKDVKYLINLNSEKYEIPIPPDFDDEYYLSMNPDVASARQNGSFKNGFEHYYLYGRKEGRQRPSK